jgi:hypothetical protein
MGKSRAKVHGVHLQKELRAVVPLSWHAAELPLIHERINSRAGERAVKAEQHDEYRSEPELCP